MDDCIACIGIKNGHEYVEQFLRTDNVVGYVLKKEALSRGHCIFLPIKHYEKMTDVENYILKELIIWIKRVANILELDNFNILNNNGALAFQTLFHVHFHLIPKTHEDNGLQYLRDKNEDRDVDQSKLAEKISQELQKFSSDVEK